MAQESSKRDQESTGCQPKEGPVPCTNGCGFFGNFATLNLCSKCYRDRVLKEAKATSAKAAAEKVVLSAEIQEQSAIKLTSIDTNNTACSSAAAGESSRVEQPACAAAADEASPKVEQQEGSRQQPQQPPQQPPNRCFSCKKRVGLTGVKCRCGNTFCYLHRYSDKHDCSYDYKAAGRDDIAQANPQMKAAKLQNKI